MASPLSLVEWAYLRAHRVGHLATADRLGRPSVVPICYADDGTAIYSALDAKPKRVTPMRLRRVRNLIENPVVSFLVDDYREDWSQLAYLLIHGWASLVEPGSAEHATAIECLRLKYPQYRSMPIDSQPAIRILPTSATAWGDLERASD